ncbi:MAG: protein-S-isoprenylcysteine methyltransferase [Acidobacteriales bacterium]|nr:protein-S-isoprenylcysteine methyltransferase [Terriglobales bacterium]
MLLKEQVISIQSKPEVVAPITQKRDGRHWTDWAGCALYLCLAVDLLVHSPKIGILLLPGVLHETVVAASFLLRRPLAQQAKGLGPRIAAYVGTFMMVAFVRLASSYYPAWVEHTNGLLLNRLGISFWFIGTLFGLYSLWYFRHAFSLVPQARELVTSGPFRIARHPIYLSYVLQYIGIWLTHKTTAMGIVLVLWFAVMLIRMKYEEALLMAVFPEYALYKLQVRAIYPRLPRRVIATAPPRTIHATHRSVGKAA